MAAFQVIIYGRMGVITEAHAPSGRASRATKSSRI